MPETVYLNGAYVPAASAQVSVFDRGLLFADAIYEVCGVIDGKLIDFDGHMRRLDRSMAEMQMTCRLSHRDLLDIMRTLVARERVQEGLVYLQFTRGSTGDRDFLPMLDTPMTIFGFAQPKSDAFRKEIKNGVRMVSAPDLRWKRRDIKSVGLLASVFAKMHAQSGGGQEALLHEDGIVTEGAATSFFMIKGCNLITRPLSRAILHGCTRAALMDMLNDGNLELEEREFSVQEARNADEAFLTGASTYVCPVVAIDDTTLGDGAPGVITQELQQRYVNLARKQAI